MSKVFRNPGDQPGNTDWFEQFRGGDQRAAEVVYHLHYTSLLYAATTLLRNKEEAEEVFDDCITRAWNHRADFESRVHLRNWLAQTVRNAAISILRSRKTQPGPLEELRDNEGTADGQEEAFDLELTRAALMERVKVELLHLKPRYQTVLTLHFFEGKTVAEIAVIMNESEQNVRLIRLRAVGKLRNRLGDQWPLVLLLGIIKEIF